MRKSVLFLFSLVFLLNACYTDDINDLNKKYDELRAEQLRQAELLVQYQALLQALEQRLTVSSLTQTADGLEIVFSNGNKMVLKNGQDGADGHTPVITIGANGNWLIDGTDTGVKAAGTNGTNGDTPTIGANGNWFIGGTDTGVKAAGTNGTDGQEAPRIIGVVDVGGTIIFYLSDGTTVTLGKMETIGLWVLSEGSWGSGNGQLRGYSYDSGTGNFTADATKRFQNYGDTPNDLLIYGSKMYCAITGKDNTSTDGLGALVRVIDPKTGVTVQDIVIPDGTNRHQPRHIAAEGGKVYVTLYGGAVAQIDTTSFTANVTPLSGSYSDGIAVYGSSLYICNSGQGADNRISVVDITSFTETETITVPYNPTIIVKAGNELYFTTADIYSGATVVTSANVHVLNPATKAVTTLGVNADFIAAGRQYVYATITDWNSYSAGVVQKIAIADKTVSTFAATPSQLPMWTYKLSVNPVTSEVFVTQGMGQTVARFKEDGTRIQNLSVGQQNGAAVVFVNTIK
ncbi:MAG: hypothetical protein LBS52_06130 [Dysgonamonadaceae bacterium]|jgi:hypothetical protein|nr:hypothetical protein [Dysgonamonadaceae bacterium]